MPVNYVTTPAGYTRLALLRPGESPHFCRANFRSGTPQLPVLNLPYPITVRAVDRYGNLMGGAADTVGLAQASGPAATLGPRAALASGQAVTPVTYSAHGTSVTARRRWLAPRRPWCPRCACATWRGIRWRGCR
jgi:hypothetical protein